ncbi:MAG TPA: MOSC domain-containing protein [Stellaceae bacterium]|nr:MOSC domain-containing protein [Stellaceae bacterium]
MAMTVAALYRYPVKGLSAEPLARVALAPRECLPQDRRFALALAATRFDPQRPEWLAKIHFAMLMRDAKLAQLHTRFDAASGLFTAERDGRTVLRETITEPEGRRRIGAFFTEFLGDAVDGPLRVVEAPGHAFADARPKPNASTDKYISLINLASLRELEGAVAAPVAPLRFRANLYFDGAPEWAELGWLGRDIAIGAARLRGVAAITRCAATEVNPDTAERDLDIPGALQRRFGHNLMGIYAEVLGGGEIGVGDAITVHS